jgi:hypothetical protein
MNLNTTKLQALNQKRNGKIERGGAGKWIWRAGKWWMKSYPKSGGPEIEMQYKHGQPGRRV